MSDTPIKDPVQQAKDALLSVTRGAVDPTMAEDVSFINVREVEDWCKESREYRPPLLSSMNLLILALGLLVGFVPAFAATDVDENGGWWGIFLLGSIIAGGLCILALISMIVELPRVRRTLHREARMSPLDRLSERMQRASEKGLLRAAAAESALRERQEKEREDEVAS